MVHEQMLAYEVYAPPVNHFNITPNISVDVFSVLTDPLHVQLLIIGSGITILMGIILAILPHYFIVKNIRLLLTYYISPISLSIVRVALGITFFFGSFSHQVFGPEIALKTLPGSVMLEPVLFTIGICLVLGVGSSIAALVGLGIFALAFLAKGTYMLAYAITGTVCFIIASKYIFNISKNTKIAALRIALGVTFLYTAINVKLMQPWMSINTVLDFRLQNYIPFDTTFIALGTFLVEATLGLLLILGIFTRTAAAITLGLFSISLLYFSGEPLWAHILIMSVCVVLFVEGYGSYGLDGVLNRFVRRMLNVPVMQKKKVLILGGGFAGISAALELLRLTKNNADITLVNDTEYHALHPAFYEAATYEQPSRAISIPLSAIFAGKPVTLKIGKVQNIDTGSHRVIMKNGEQLHYEKLVVALGSESNDFGTPGVKEYSISLKTLDDAMQIQSHIRMLFEHACNEEECRPIHIVIGGGGFTGVELVGEIQTYTKKLQEQFGIPSQLVHIHLVHSQAHVLSGLDEGIGQRVQQRLQALGIHMVMGSRIARVSKTELTLKDGRVVPCSILIWTAGIKGNSILTTSGLDRDAENRVLVTSTLQAKNNPDVYICGDSAAFALPGSSEKQPQFAPAVAQVAIEQGACAGRNLYYEMMGLPLVPYMFRHMGYVIPVSGRYAYAHINSITFEGFLAYVVQQLFILYWLMSILPWRNALLRFDLFETQLMAND